MQELISQKIQHSPSGQISLFCRNVVEVWEFWYQSELEHLSGQNRLRPGTQHSDLFHVFLCSLPWTDP